MAGAFLGDIERKMPRQPRLDAPGTLHHVMGQVKGDVVHSIQKRQSKPMRNRKGAGISLLGLKAGIGATWLEGFAGSAYFFAGDGRVTGVG